MKAVKEKLASALGQPSLLQADQLVTTEQVCPEPSSKAAPRLYGAVARAKQAKQEHGSRNGTNLKARNGTRGHTRLTFYPCVSQLRKLSSIMRRHCCRRGMVKEHISSCDARDRIPRKFRSATANKIFALVLLDCLASGSAFVGAGSHWFTNGALR